MFIKYPNFRVEYLGNKSVINQWILILHESAVKKWVAFTSCCVHRFYYLFVNQRFGNLFAHQRICYSFAIDIYLRTDKKRTFP